MNQLRSGSFQLFRFAGITVYLHWSWFLVALIQMRSPVPNFTTPVWNVLLYLTLFAIVLLHEFGHALACRSVGGIADHIVLWPLGGVAYVLPPPRPGATLWSIAAGPLVNVALVPVTLGLVVAGDRLGWAEQWPDLHKFLWACLAINGVLLVFNLLPVYPLDGGQILQSILWFFLGRGRSLMVASGTGMLGAAALLALVIRLGFADHWWLGILAVFIGLRSWAGWRAARVLLEMQDAPRHSDYACPACHNAPLQGDLWGCDECGTRFDVFVYNGVCPNCSNRFEETGCPECHRRHPIDAWRKAAAEAPEQSRTV